MEDNVIVIGTDLDKTKFEKKYNKLKADLEKEELNLEVKVHEREDVEQKLREANLALEEQLNKQKEINKEIEKYKKQYDILETRFKSGDRLAPEEENRKQFLASKLDDLYKEQDVLTEKSQKYQEAVNKAYDNLAKANRALDSQEKKVVNIRQEFAELNETIQEHNLAIQEQNLDNVNLQLKKIGKSITDITKKVGRWALAIFGVRSAYMFVRNAINVISQEDEQLKNDIQTIKIALAYTIEPLVRGIVNLAKLLVQYLGYIVQAWTKRDIFAKSANSLANANKSAKALNKSLFSFDKLNKISGSGTTENGKGISTGIKPLEEADAPGWLKWIGDNGDKVATILMSISAGLVAIKLGADLIMASAVGVAVFSIVMAVKDLIELFKDPTWEKFGNIVIDIGFAVMALGVIFNGLPIIIGGAIAVVVGLIIKYWDQCKEYVIAGVMFFVDTFIGALKGIGDFFKIIFYGIYDIFKDVIYAIISLFKGDFKSAITYLGKAIGNVFITIINTVINAINTVISPIRALVVAVGRVTGKKWTMDNIKIPTIPRLEQGGIVHNPGRGVMMGNYIAGEGRNPEAVIPLDDATLDKLGQAIARHSQINATIVNEMDGRVLSKNLARVQSENNFARNGGY